MAVSLALGLPEGYTMHDGRHSFAVRLTRKVADPQLIASNLGHRDGTVIHRIYGKYRPKASDFRRALSRTVES